MALELYSRWCRPLQSESTSRPAALVAIGIALSCASCGPSLPEDPLGVTRERVVQVSEQALVPTDAPLDLEFEATAFDGETVILGATSSDVYGSGRAHFLSRQGAEFVEQAQVSAGAPPFASFFGDGVAIHGDVALVKSSPSPYVLRRSGSNWTVEGTLAMSGSVSAVAIHGDTAALGANLSETGRVEVFRNSPSGWMLEQTLMADDAAPTPHFGAPLVLENDLLLVGAPARYNPVFAYGDEPPGAVYVFRRIQGTWQRTQKLAPNDSAAADLFGASIALTTGTLAVGAPGANAEEGGVYVFEDDTSGFIATAKLSSFPSGASPSGYRVGVSSHWLVNVPYEGGSAGALDLFEREGSSWQPVTVIQSTDGAVGLGSTVRVVGNTIVAGAEGQAFAFSLSGDEVCTPDGSAVSSSNGEVPCAPYRCFAGACANTCTDSAACAVGYVCDRTQGQGACVDASSGTSDDSAGCGVAGAPSGSGWALLALMLWGAWRRPRR